MIYDGLQIKSRLDPGADTSDTAEYLEWSEAEITWFEVGANFLNGTDDTLTPSEILQLHFGNDLSSPTDGLSGGFTNALVDTLTDGGTVPLPLTGDDQILAWRESLTIAYMVTAIIGNLPPITSTDPDQVVGFLDSTKSWGLVYDVDVQYKNMSAEVSGFLATGWLGGGGGDADTTSAQRTAAITAAQCADGWIDADDTGDDASSPSNADEATSIYPYKTYRDLVGFGAGGSWYEVAGASGTDWHGEASTYGIEAIGYDSFSDPAGPPDANEFLHSNEVFRVVPMGAQGTAWGNDPSWYSVYTEASYQDLLWEYPWETRQIFAGAYHALRDYDDDATTVSEDAAWCKTYDQEVEDMISAIDAACSLIGPELETVTFPKRLINHIQRRKKIPNNMVSAFGYVPGEMYTAGTADVYASDASDRDSYEPVTGEMTEFTINDEGEITYSSLPSTDPTSTVPGGYGTRGTAEGWDDDGGGGEGWESDD
jgi:hypothetical protein